MSRIEVSFKKETKNTQDTSIKNKIKEDLFVSVKEIRTVNVYTIDADLSKEQLKILGENDDFDLLL